MTLTQKILFGVAVVVMVAGAVRTTGWRTVKQDDKVRWLKYQIERTAPGTCIKIEPGTYVFTEPLEISKQITLIGSGKQTVFKGVRTPVLHISSNAAVANLSIHTTDVVADKSYAIRISSPATQVELVGCVIRHRGSGGSVCGILRETGQVTLVDCNVSLTACSKADLAFDPKYIATAAKRDVAF